MHIEYIDMSGLWSYRSKTSQVDAVAEARKMLPFAFLGEDLSEAHKGFPSVAPSGCNDGQVERLTEPLASDAPESGLADLTPIETWFSRAIDDEVSRVEQELGASHSHVTSAVDTAMVDIIAGKLFASRSNTGEVVSSPPVSSEVESDDGVSQLFKRLDDIAKEAGLQSTPNGSTTVHTDTVHDAQRVVIPSATTRTSSRGNATTATKPPLHSLRSNVNAPASSRRTELQQEQKEVKLLATRVRENLKSTQVEVTEEVERARCVLALSNIKQLQRNKPIASQQVAGGLHRAKLTRTPSSNCATSSKTSTSSTTEQPQSKASPQPDAPSAGKKALPSTDPKVWERLSRSLTAREAEINRTAQEGRIIFDPRRRRDEHLKTLYNNAVDAQMAAQRLASDRLNRAVEHHRRSMLKVGWLPWKKLLFIRRWLERNGTSIYCYKLRRKVLSEWRFLVTVSKTVNWTKSVARCVAIIRFLLFCWKRSVFMLWRCKVALRVSMERTADRFRKQTLLSKWSSRGVARRCSRQAALEMRGEYAAHLALRRVKSNVFQRWKNRTEGQVIDREAQNFRRAIEVAIHEKLRRH